MTEPKVVPHQKPVKPPRPYREPKPKRYAVEKYVRRWEGNYWRFVEDYRFARNAKYWARYWESVHPEFRWRVVDRKDTE